MNRSKDMARPFVGSVADVLARTRRTICKNPGNAALALRRSHRCFPKPSTSYGDGRAELRQTRNPGNWLATRGRPQEACLIQSGLSGPTLF